MKITNDRIPAELAFEIEQESRWERTWAAWWGFVAAYDRRGTVLEKSLEALKDTIDLVNCDSCGREKCQSCLEETASARATLTAAREELKGP